MRKLTQGLGALIAAVCLLSGCASTDEEPSATVPPVAPSHKIAGSTFPASIAGYTALGSEPAAGQMTVTYAADASPLQLAVVTFDDSGEMGTSALSEQNWYGTSRCGFAWRGDVNSTPRPSQSACVTVLTDGVMSVVAGGDQTPEQLADFANAIQATLE